MSLPVIDAQFVERHLTMAACIDLVADVQAQISAGRIELPLRRFHSVGDGAGHFGLMPGELPAGDVFGAKLISLFPDNPATADLPAIQGHVLLFDRHNGAPLACIDAASITGLRTAAASGAATRVLAREDARTLALLGYGVQARTHLAAMCAVRDIDRVFVWGPTLSKAQAFAASVKHPGITVQAVASAAQAVSGADIVCAVSGAREPIVHGAELAAGCHVNLVGAHSPSAREADTAAVLRARVFTEITEFALAEAGDLMIPIQAQEYAASMIAGEIGAVVSGDLIGRQRPDQVTLYKSLGNTAQDLVSANYVLQQYRQVVG